MIRIPVCEPFLDGNEKKYVDECISTGWISSSGRFIKEFEEKFAEYCGAKYAVCTSNGTVALHLAIVSAGIGKGDEVIIPDFTMIATAFAVCYTGAVPVFIDACHDNWNIDVTKIEEKITARTKAIIPVSIFGHPCEMDELKALAKKYDLIIIEDAAESHGAEYKGIKLGSIADLTAFSFFANKNVTTGEGGAVVTNSEDLYRNAQYYKNLCFPLNSRRSYSHDDIGFNYRMSNIHAAIGLAQVEKADYYKSLRIRNHNIYVRNLNDIQGIRFQQSKDYVTNVYWMNSIIIDSSEYGKSRDQLICYLNDNGIDTRLLFKGMHTQKSLIKFGCDCSGLYPITNLLSENGFYLPSASNLAEDDIKFICGLIRELRIK